jgi:hypothetical protein
MLFSSQYSPCSKAGRAHVRGVLVEAAWSPSRAPGPLRAFYQRVNARRGFQNAVVATARKMIVLAWHLVTKDQDSPSPDPARSATNAASLNSKPAPITAWEHPSGRRGLQQQAKRTEQGAAAEQAEPAYQLLVAHWQTRKPATSGSWVDDFRAAQHPADLDFVVHGLFPGVVPRPHDRRIALRPGLDELVERSRAPALTSA